MHGLRDVRVTSMHRRLGYRVRRRRRRGQLPAQRVVRDHRVPSWLLPDRVRSDQRYALLRPMPGRPVRPERHVVRRVPRVQGAVLPRRGLRVLQRHAAECRRRLRVRAGDGVPDRAVRPVRPGLLQRLDAGDSGELVKTGFTRFERGLN